ncbi:uncharacterized protein C4orf3-like [Trichechus manatus latirostris]|uniref:Uncharacterized protein C4orf3-like n=1 Tax=Trichechus manatus latirostris TaxID=127582 RepID=A0A2Y9DRF9_TRIMA|nr:uncharacterized protein C4orf3-like [Trichechus manatus latirostris]
MEVGAETVVGQGRLRERRGLSEAGRQEQNCDVQPQSGSNMIPKHSYWLDIWLFILFDLMVFFFVYFMP